MIRNRSQNVPHFDRPGFDRMASLDNLWWQLLQLQEFGCRQNDTHMVVDLMQPLP